jgi:menaquinone-dependent protoporphyrinogen oxidase
MSNRVLIIYATRAGSTAGIASAIGETLRGRGFTVDIEAVKSKPSLDGYQAVILGSAVRMGSWLPEMLDFIKANQTALNALPVALFTVHILNAGDDETSRAARLAYLDHVRPLIHSADEVFFTGAIDLEKLSFIDHWMVKTIKSPIGDHRDRGKIRDWANLVLTER